MTFSRLYDEGFRPGLSTGWKTLDAHYTVRSGEISIITGIPGHGKSNFLDALMVNLFQQHGWRFAICRSRELASSTSWPRPFLKSISGRGLRPAGRSYSWERMSKDDLYSGMSDLHEGFHFIMLPEEKMTVDHVLAVAKSALARHGINGVGH